MRRREFIASTALSVLTLSGCLTLGRTSSVSPPTTTTPDLPYRFRITNYAQNPIRFEISLIKLADDGSTIGEPAHQTYELKPRKQISLSDQLEKSTSYRVSMKITGGAEKQWNLYLYNSFDVNILSPTEIESSVTEV